MKRLIGEWQNKGGNFSEGIVQVLALTETIDWLDAKAVLTPLKLKLFFLGIATTIGGWAIWLVGDSDELNLL